MVISACDVLDATYSTYKKFGKPEAARERYPVGSSFHASANVIPCRPMRGHGGLCETSNPVAQTIASTSWSLPSTVLIPVASIRSMASVTKLTSSRVKASK